MSFGERSTANTVAELDLKYDPAALRCRAAHIGVGAFHRAHQQTYYDDLARSGERDWGVVGLNLTPPDLSQVHARQDRRYSVMTEDQQFRAVRRIGTLRKLFSGADPRSAFWDPVSIVTLTITEKGYCHASGTSRLDMNSAIAADIEAPERPKTAIGFLALLLECRRRRGGSGITLASCDNVSGNGDILHSVLHEYAAAVFPGLPAWLEKNVTFPNSMVDRIVPAMDAASKARLESVLDGPDDLGVIAEPFRQWVIQDRFAAERPPLETVGVQIVSSITVFEHMKHRLLNGLQSAFAELGRIVGLSTTAEAACDPALRAWASSFLADQAETLTCPPGENLATYSESCLRRLANPHVRHSLNQIASDASYKLPQRLLAPAAELIERQRSASHQAAVVAAWITQAGGHEPDAPGIRVNDPGGASIAELRDSGGDEVEITNAIVRPPIFPEGLAGSAKFKGDVADWLKTFRSERDTAALRRRLIETAKRRQ